MKKKLSKKKRINLAAEIAAQYGGDENANQKQWVINQMLLTMLGHRGYEKWLDRHKFDAWMAGTAPKEIQK